MSQDLFNGVAEQIHLAAQLKNLPSACIFFLACFRQTLGKHSLHLAFLKFLPDLKSRARGAKRRARGMAAVAGRNMAGGGSEVLGAAASGVTAERGVVGMGKRRAAGEVGGDVAMRCCGESMGQKGGRVGREFLGRRAEGLLRGIGNDRRALGRKGLRNWVFWFSSVWMGSWVRQRVVWAQLGGVKRDTPPHFLTGVLAVGRGVRAGLVFPTVSSVLC